MWDFSFPLLPPLAGCLCLGPGRGEKSFRWIRAWLSCWDLLQVIFYIFFLVGGQRVALAAGVGQRWGAQSGWFRVGETAISPSINPPGTPPRHRELAPQRILGHRSGLAARWPQGTVGTRSKPGVRGGASASRAGPKIPGGELMINHGRDGGGDGRGQRGERPRIVLPAGTGSGQNLGMAQPGRDGSLEQLWG